ncbi:uncharacterized protein LOC126765914 [Bactrocera neohumeralis]|uniref:uncharacterized protein LOC126765914 n=1 Tax=Bactrocera neohumeralis TaxID=98809 RepID=UPI0021668B90|nr:uncharacterized protein LOC126765914 [Bactrocera neohumeralis]
MFRQVEINPLHRKWQRILWRESPVEPLRSFELATVTYGMTSSPYNAIRSLRQCAVDNYSIVEDENRASTARNSILDGFYVDDYLESSDSLVEAVSCAHDVDAILRQGQFILGKWNSNCAKALHAITDPEKSEAEIELCDSNATVLGLHWNPLSDELFFKVTIEDSHTLPTKRSILSDVARLYDPIGILAPAVVLAKMFIQTLWRKDLNWDTPLPIELQDQWLEFRNGLHELARVRVPRWLSMSPHAFCTLHGFCDASSKAYAAVIYVNSAAQGDLSNMALVTAKTKVAPVKQITIPRLELCAAHLLVVTLRHVQKALHLDNVPYTLWSDSTIVLHWIHKQPSVLKQFVGNRVAYIQAHTKVECWRHVRSEYNPADCASRGIMPARLLNHPLWWTGPPPRYICIDNDPVVPELTEEQLQAQALECQPFRTLITTRQDHHQCLMTSACGHRIPLVEKFSILSRVLNTTARLRRFLPCYKGQRSNIVTAEEYEWALLLTVKQAQGKAYRREINALKSNSRLDSRNHLLALNPYVDPEGILRVGGRLRNAAISNEQRHPMIIPKGSFANLLIADSHRRCLHGGIQQMLQYLRRRFWIIHARSQVKAYIWKCTVCRRHQRILQNQQMASLPRERVFAAPVFSNSGLDYCGPFHVRIGSRRSTTTLKTYAAIFICMASRAVHIELAEDLSTRSFIDVYDRFISRRGICAKLFSDNGTQFVGADRQMREDVKEWVSSYAQQHVAHVGTQWKFITPAAPHHGGIWEAAVRSAKKHLLRIMGQQSLRYHELLTLLTRIEACLNSRPIIALHDDPEGGLALTPGDFIIGRPINCRPEPPLPDIPHNRLHYWQRLQGMFEHFWKRWQNEYLNSLQARSKWMRPEPNLQIGDVVIIRNENLPPACWRMGRITDTHPGSDGLVRVITIEYNGDRLTDEGMYVKRHCQRPVQKVVRLTGMHEEILNREGSAGEDVQD